ncbi:acyl-CoA Delta(11) desaturase-like [Oppia nitens]|uniref:acyl-CoA Delta(11) desaturase-like n=1 Tax=Oppia nitens TaxID=1686743 RepID=UPI0023DC22BA|nr:acyl-CoA Delta(11) desaturase-like [Oppia nitens]
MDSNGTNADTKVVKPYKLELVWRNIILMAIIHISGLYGAYLTIRGVKVQTVIFTYVIALMSSMGIQCGAHRLWCHRTYKAKLPLQIILMVLQTLALQNDIFEWSRDHRLHHKYSDTDADPHNSQRGFFFSHVGWLLCKKHPEVKERGKTLDMTDLAKDPLVRFQRAFYIPLLGLIWAAFPTYIPYLLWGESLWNSWFICVMLRYAATLNLTWCVNSAAHMWGMKPYDKDIVPVEAHMRHYLMGEGFHNYHHAFPWDYSASELGPWDAFNPATAFIDMFASIGWAYDLKKASKEIVESRQKRVGDVGYNHRSLFIEMLTGISVLFAPIWIYVFVKQFDIWVLPLCLFIAYKFK